jgi:hypothetical protein
MPTKHTIGPERVRDAATVIISSVEYGRELDKVAVPGEQLEMLSVIFDVAHVCVDPLSKGPPITRDGVPSRVEIVGSPRVAERVRGIRTVGDDADSVDDPRREDD